jgi:hypothetical protein
MEYSRLTQSDGTVEYASVHVYGPRRLKSGELGKPISSFRWQQARNEGYRGYVPRPDWLSALIAQHLPAGWSPSLVELPESAS